MSEGKSLEIGFARTDVTPPVGVPMSGYTFLRKVSEVRDPLELNAVALSDGGVRGVLIAADMLDLQDFDFACSLRKRIAESCGISSDAVFFHTTHTHLSPALGRATPSCETSFDGDAAYGERFVENACAAAKAAFADLAPATIAIGRAEAKRISFIRRFRMKDGSIRTNPGVGIPGEPFTEIGRRIKTESKYAMTFVSCLTNGSFGYFPTASAYSEGGYEARSSIFGPSVADDIVRKSIGLLEQKRER